MFQSPSATPSRRGSAPPAQPGASETHATMPCRPLVIGISRTSWPAPSASTRVRSSACPARARSARCGCRSWAGRWPPAMSSSQSSVRDQRLGDVADDRRAAGRADVACELAAGASNTSVGAIERARPLARLHAVGDRRCLPRTGAREKSVSWLLSRKPRTIRRGRRSRSSIEVVIDTALPKPSTIEMCVVARSRCGSSARPSRR